MHVHAARPFPSHHSLRFPSYPTFSLVVYPSHIPFLSLPVYVSARVMILIVYK